MADETNKEILEEIGEDVTERTQTEGITEGTQTEGTTGNGYLTKPYLVRNLQTFWGKIKQYITNQKFVNEDTVRGALLSKADQSDLDSLEDIVGGKADTLTLTALETSLTEALAKKVDNVEGKTLTSNDFTNLDKQKLDGLKNYTEATTTESGLMSTSDKEKLEGIAAGATAITVDSEWNANSENPAQSKVISEFINGELAKKADKETAPSDPSELIRLNNITSYATDEGHIVLNFIKDTEHLRIYTPNSDRPVEKVSLKDQNEILFTNFQKNDDDTLAITIENPEGKSEGSWNINSNIPFNFYIESLTVDNKKYKPFMLQAVRPDEYNLSKVQLSIAKIFES